MSSVETESFCLFLKNTSDSDDDDNKAGFQSKRNQIMNGSPVLHFTAQEHGLPPFCTATIKTFLARKRGCAGIEAF